MAKIYISVDIEGVTGVVHWNETEHGKADYDYFRKIMAKETRTLITETVEIVAGKLEPVISYKTKKDSNGQSYKEAHVDQPGGRRKDQLIGCKIEIVVDDVVVKTETDGTLSLEKATRRR